jgi:putative transposase
MLKIVEDPAEPNPAGGSMLDEIVRDGARLMLAAALQAEVAAFVDAHREVDEQGPGWWSVTASMRSGR